MVVFVKCRRSESKCFKRSYVFVDLHSSVDLQLVADFLQRPRPCSALEDLNAVSLL